jgi:hypothetical protein
MRKALLALLALWSCGAMAGVINFEVHFTPFVGDIAKSHVETVPGRAFVYLNNVPIAEQDVEKKRVPVIFDNREIAAAVWVPAKGLGGLVRKGRNTIRIEFVPADMKASYQSRLQWNEVTDQVTRQGSGGSGTSTNRGGQGMETKKSQGKVVLERDFTGDFATELPWHRYPPVSALNDEDRQKLAALVKDHAAAFKPKFDALYKALATKPELDVKEIRKIGCVEKAYAAGVRVPVPAAAELEFATTGSAVVIVSRKSGWLYPFDRKSFAKLKGEEMQMCAGIVLSMTYPPRLVVAKAPDGRWEVVY